MLYFYLEFDNDLESSLWMNYIIPHNYESNKRNWQSVASSKY